jgi:hypothetical protein
MFMLVHRSAATLAAALLATAALNSTAGAAPQTASNTPRQEFTATAVNMSTVGSPGASQVEIVVKRYTTDAARDRLMSVFREKGASGLLKALQSEPSVGSIATRGSLAYDLRYARELPGEEGGRRLVLATDRPIGFAEAQSSSRTLDYPFTLVELRLDRDGRGEGKLSIATKLTLNDNVLVIEDYADQPVMLKDVRKR